MTTAHGYAPLGSGAVLHTWTTASPRAVVVLQHGYGEYAERWVDQHGELVARLLEDGIEVWALDLWGHGRSPGRRGGTSVRRAVRDHLAVRRRAARGDLPMVLIGHSLGGLVTAASVVASPGGLAGVVLMSPALPRAEPAPVRRALGAVARVAPGVPIPRRRRPLGELSRLAAVGARAAADPLMFGGQVRVLTAATALDEAEGVRRGASQWRVPVLVLHGTADTYTDPAASSDLVHDLATPDKTLRLLVGARHELANDTCAEEVLDTVQSWVAARIRPRRTRT